MRSVAIRHRYKQQMRTGAFRGYQEIIMILYYLGDNSAIYVKTLLFPDKKEAKSDGGGGEIRTHGRVTPTTIFKTVALNRSATPPLNLKA